MKETDLQTRERIMQYTLELVKNESDYSKITTRRIVSNAGVSLSAVNYYFGSKEKLINEVIKRPILEFLASAGNPYEMYPKDPIRIFKEIVKLPARYLAQNPNISKISIMSDMSDPIENDLTEQTVKYIMPAAKDALTNMDEKQVQIEVWSLVSLIQTAFIRNKNFLKLTGVDYFSDNDRDMFLEGYIDILAEKNGGVLND